MINQSLRNRWQYGGSINMCVKTINFNEHNMINLYALTSTNTHITIITKLV